MTRTRGQGSADRPAIRFSKPVYDWLLAIQQERAAKLGRDVSFTEVVEYLRNLLDERAGVA